MTASRKNILLVEGDDDKRIIIQLMAKYVEWGDKPEEWPVDVTPQGGVKKLLRPTTISTHIKSANSVGIVVDADEEFAPRWESVRNLCRQHFPAIPDELPAEGLFVENEEQKCLGIWIMPDNKSRGMLETFLQFLIPKPAEAVWRHACEATITAVAKGAKCKNIHRDKSHIHTWLAWQDPPGQSMSNALLQNMLDARAPYAEAFVNWFCRLYKLQRLR